MMKEKQFLAQLAYYSPSSFLSSMLACICMFNKDRNQPLIKVDLIMSDQNLILHLILSCVRKESAQVQLYYPTIKYAHFISGLSKSCFILSNYIHICNSHAYNYSYIKKYYLGTYVVTYT